MEGLICMQAQPVEDIEAVMGRFQAWAGSQNAVEARPGIRELSHDEALKLNRYRWKGANSPFAKTKACAERGVVPTTAPVTVPSATPERAPKRQKMAPTKAHNANRKTVKKVFVNSRSKAAKSDVKAAPEFKEALANAVRPMEVIVAASQPIDLARQVSISVRLTPAEQVLIKLRAAASGISASAYMRQCALEVEQLRAQVQQAIAAMEQKTSTPLQKTSPSGFLARLARRIFPRCTPSPATRIANVDWLLRRELCD
jgi:hypothetical protein